MSDETETMSEYEKLKHLLTRHFETWLVDGVVKQALSGGLTLKLYSEDPEAEYTIALFTNVDVLIWKVDCSNAPATVGYGIWVATLDAHLR